MNRKTTRLILLAALAMTASLAACNKNEAKMNETAPVAKSSGGWGSGPYTEWQPITPPSKQGK